MFAEEFVWEDVFSAMRMGCFLIFVAPKDYWMLGLCTSHAFFSLLNVFVHLDGC